MNKEKLIKLIIAAKYRKEPGSFWCVSLLERARNALKRHGIKLNEFQPLRCLRLPDGRRKYRIYLLDEEKNERFVWAIFEVKDVFEHGQKSGMTARFCGYVLNEEVEKRISENIEEAKRLLGVK